MTAARFGWRLSCLAAALLAGASAPQAGQSAAEDGGPAVDASGRMRLDAGPLVVGAAASAPEATGAPDATGHAAASGAGSRTPGASPSTPARPRLRLDWLPTPPRLPAAGPSEPALPQSADPQAEGSTSVPPDPAEPAVRPRVAIALRSRIESDRTSTAGPVAEANRWSAGLVPMPRTPVNLALDLDSSARLGKHSVSAKASVSAQYRQHDPVGGNGVRAKGQLRELAWQYDAEPWGLTVGRKVMGWDVGHAFRPNDLVQMENRSALLPDPLVGVDLVAAEHFTADGAVSAVLVNPQNLGRDALAAVGRQEAALVGRLYRRFGGVDTYAYARHGRHSRASLGLSAAWVATDAIEVHGSVRALERALVWNRDTAAGDWVAADPWSLQWRGPATQWLLGASWTGEARQTVLLEWWYDGTATGWADWRSRNLRLADQAPGTGLTPQQIAGNFAWQGVPLGGVPDTPGPLHRHNALLRISKQFGAWEGAVETIWHPADGGWLVTPSLKWQGERTTFELAWRHAGGPSSALVRQLPLRDWAAATVRFAF